MDYKLFWMLGLFLFLVSCDTTYVYNHQELDEIEAKNIQAQKESNPGDQAINIQSPNENTGANPSIQNQGESQASKTISPLTR